MAETPADDWDLLEELDGVNLPDDEVSVFTDLKAAKTLNRLLDEEKEREEAAKKPKNKDTLSLADDSDYFDVEAFEAELNEAYAALEASKITFELRGLAPELIKAITREKTAKHNHKPNDENDTAFYEDVNYTISARTIVAARKADGKRSTAVWTPERLQKLEAKLHDTQWAKLYSAIIDINYDAQLFDRAVSADFS